MSTPTPDHATPRHAFELNKGQSMLFNHPIQHVTNNVKPPSVHVIQPPDPARDQQRQAAPVYVIQPPNPARDQQLQAAAGPCYSTTRFST